MRSIGKKINLLFGVLLLVISSTIIIYNAVSQQASITRQLTGTELPLRADSVINSIDKKLLEPARNLDLVTNGPLLQNWIKNGEPNSELETIYQMLANMVKTYGCLGANFVSQTTRQYTDLIGGKRDYSYRVDDKKDPWFSGFRDSGAETNIVVYVDDPVWGTKAFINRRVSVNGKFAGLLSTSIDIQDFAREINSMSIGEKGTLLITDQEGLIRFASDTRNINRNLQEIAPAYREFWSRATTEDGFQITYKDDSGDTRYTIVRKIPVLDYFLCLEASGQEMLGEVQFNIWIGIAISLVLVLLGLVIAFVFVKGIVRPIRQTADFALAVSRGELDRNLEVRGQDETGVLADALRGMVSALKQKIAQAEEQEQRAKEDARRTEEALHNVELQQQKIQTILDGMRHGTEEIGKVSASLNEVARELGRRNENVGRGAEEQYASLLNTSEDIAMMMDKFHEILHGAGTTSESVESARGKALEGEKSVQNVIAANRRVNDAAGQMQQAMQSLESQAEGINRIVSTINDIADQTNLLALNAAIEAARAGDAGRGFAVVADEVRKLAEKTMIATKDVSDAITSVQQSARENMRTMEETYAAVHEATELAGGSGESLRSIVELSEKNAGQVRGIADSVSSLVAYSENITGSLERVNTIARDTQSGMEAAAGELRELISISSGLDKLILQLQETAK